MDALKLEETQETRVKFLPMLSSVIRNARFSWRSDIYKNIKTLLKLMLEMILMADRMRLRFCHNNKQACQFSGM